VHENSPVVVTVVAMGTGVESVFCTGMAVVTFGGAATTIFCTGGRWKLCGRTIPEMKVKMENNCWTITVFPDFYEGRRQNSSFCLLYNIYFGGGRQFCVEWKNRHQFVYQLLTLAVDCGDVAPCSGCFPLPHWK
jgi:hypothetical protein